MRKLGREPSLSEEENARLRAVVDELIAKHGSQAALARASKINQQNFSRLQRGARGGEALAKAVAAFIGVDWRAMIGRSTIVEVSRPTWGALPSWPAAEALARARWPRIPDEAWVQAREFSGERWPDPVTPEFVYSAARLWLDYLADPDDEEGTD